MGGQFHPPPPPSPCWFSLNNTEMVKAITLAFCSIQQHFTGAICTHFSIPNLCQSSDIRQNPDVGISDFRISGQSLIREHFHNSRSSDNIDMKLGQVTKLGKRNKTTSKTFDDDVVSANCDIIVFIQLMANLEQSGK